ncbi:MAG TPA: dihydroorotate dehydrogenase electron transfer subunit [Bacteroidota bacterium]|nr:dihydroorotate dehydrogenase electron transfer subunit [Bacteroidota bacterium]
MEAGDPRHVVVTLDAPGIARQVLPGQFVNVLISETGMPLLRRPFSVFMATDTEIQLLFNIVGSGTRQLAEKNPGDTLDILGPLGRPFTLAGSFTTPILVAGGLGVAALPLLARNLTNAGFTVRPFLGARDAGHLFDRYLGDAVVATDDGSMGFHGTIVDCLRSSLSSHPLPAPKIFACGPTPMLASLARFAAAAGIPCDVSLESPMACGIGICQGCPVELTGGDKKFALVCTDGTVFDANTIRWE